MGRSTAVFAVFAGIALLVLCGCAKPPQPPAVDVSGGQAATGKDTSVKGSADNSAAGSATTTNAEVVDAPSRRSPDSALASTYAGLQRYSDTTELRLTYHFEDGRTEVTKTTYDLQFVRPNKLRLRIASDDNQVEIESDGDRITARIIDPVTKNFGGQVVLQDAPDKPGIADLYKLTELVDPLTPNEMISALVGAPAGLDMTPIGLLLGEGGLVELASNAKRVGEKDGHQILEASIQGEKYELWISPSSGLLRRIVFPPTTRDLPAGLSRVELVADSQNILRESVQDNFSVSEDGVQVSHFVMPPLPPTSDLLGKQVKRLEFAGENKGRASVDNRAGEIAVVTWFHDHPASRLVLEQLELVRNRVSGSSVKFVPVQVDSSTGVLSRWNVKMNSVTDPNKQGRDILKVQQAPTTVILGPGNVLHYFEVGANPNIGNDVAVVLERLRGGQDVAADTLVIMQRAQAAFQQQLALAKSGDGWVEQLDTQLPAASKPERLTLKPEWQLDEVTDPGNMLIVPGKKKQILVTQGWNQIAIVDSLGKQNHTIKLALPPDEGISILRACKDKGDRALIAAATRGGRGAFLFDFAGKLLMQYPRIPQDGVAVSDLIAADLDGNRETELLIGWRGNHGVHAVALDGSQLWTNRAMPGVVSLGVADIEGQSKRHSAVLSGETGSVFLVDDSGRTLREIFAGSNSVHQAITWPGSARGFEALIARDNKPSNDDKTSITCCLALMPNGQVGVTGVNHRWKPIWQYALPGGVYRNQIDAIQSTQIDGIGPTWLMAGADGSVHLVSADGKFRDSFYTGQHIRGIAGVATNGKTLLLIASDGKVEAFSVEVAR